MGTPEQFQPGALLRARGTRQRDDVDAEKIVVKSTVASVQQEKQLESE